EARRPLRVHPLCLLLDLVPELLVERRPLSRAGGPPASVSLADRFARRVDGRTARRSRRPVPPLSLPHHHELRADMPEGPQSGEADRRDQEDDGGAPGVTPSGRPRPGFQALVELARSKAWRENASDTT